MLPRAVTNSENVRNRTAHWAVHTSGRFSTNRNPKRLNVTKKYDPSFVVWQQRLRIVSVSVANGVRALAVLVVEDDFFVRCDVAGCLREAGYTVVETESGEAAIALCKSEMTIDMVFTDINLGGTATGWDVAKRFRSEQPDMPVVYMSAQAIDRDRCVPGSVFVAKPYQHIDILSACQRLRK